MPEQSVETSIGSIDLESAERVVFGTLPEGGMDSMTSSGVEFVLCASALTAQM